MENTVAIKEITLVQLPIIKHKLKEAGVQVSKRIKDLELDSQVATLESLKIFKNLRTELNKEFSSFETQRKFIKKEINKPYVELDEVYKVEISKKYESAVNLLKDKIAFVEDKVKSEKREAVKEYFNELCVAEQIDFITFEKLNIDIKLSVTAKKYKEQVYDYITKINDDLALIKSTDFEAEILTEYKSSLNVSNAITSVKTRKELEAKEKSRLKAEQTQSRKSFLENLDMKFVEITNAYEFNEDIYITVSEIESLSIEDFRNKYSECEVKIKDVKARLLAEIEASKPKETEKEAVSEKPISTPTPEPTIKKEVAKPISAPVVEKAKEPLKIASFEVKATMTQLRVLGSFMKKNNITYKNI